MCYIYSEYGNLKLSSVDDSPGFSPIGFEVQHADLLPGRRANRAAGAGLGVVKEPTLNSYNRDV